jgi:hypothetical protein
MANRIGHGEQGETKRKGYANQTNSYVWESGRNNSTATPPKVSQNVPMASAASFFKSISPPN